jgi:hypothetical protein
LAGNPEVNENSADRIAPIGSQCYHSDGLPPFNQSASTPTSVGVHARDALADALEAIAKENPTVKQRQKIAAIFAGAAVLLWAAAPVAAAHPIQPQAPATTDQPNNGPDTPGVPDLPEPGDTPDAGD